VPRPVRKKLQSWEVIRLKASPAAFVGIVEAPDKDTALKLAIQQFKVRPADQRRLIVRPH
jgi:1,2-phenylacetyl-CoA epoxidase PaaB subunit